MKKRIGFVIALALICLIASVSFAEVIEFKHICDIATDFSTDGFTRLPLGKREIVVQYDTETHSVLSCKVNFKWNAGSMDAYRIGHVTWLAGEETVDGTVEKWGAKDISDLSCNSPIRVEISCHFSIPATKVADNSQTEIYEQQGGPQGWEWTVPHKWEDATCTQPKTCSVCNSTEGEANGHTWKEATCTQPRTCSVCNSTEGEPNGHTWKEATCTEPKICTVCSVTEGEANGHSWKDATCTEPKTCTVCNLTEGEANGHAWKDATCTEPKTCTVCGVTEGEAKGHTIVKDAAVEPTEEKTGLTEGSHCSVCSAVLKAQEVIPKLEKKEEDKEEEQEKEPQPEPAPAPAKPAFELNELVKIVDKTGKTEITFYNDLTFKATYEDGSYELGDFRFREGKLYLVNSRDTEKTQMFISRLEDGTAEKFATLAFTASREGGETFEFEINQKDYWAIETGCY